MASTSSRCMYSNKSKTKDKGQSCEIQGLANEKASSFSLICPHLLSSLSTIKRACLDLPSALQTDQRVEVSLSTPSQRLCLVLLITKNLVTSSSLLSFSQSQSERHSINVQHVHEEDCFNALPPFSSSRFIK